MVLAPLSAPRGEQLSPMVSLNSWQSLMLLYLATIHIYFERALMFARLLLEKEVYKAYD